MRSSWPMNSIDEAMGGSRESDPSQSDAGIHLTASTKNAQDAFVKRLKDNGIATSIRDTRGSDIDGACGQLATAVAEGKRGTGRCRYDQERFFAHVFARGYDMREVLSFLADVERTITGQQEDPKKIVTAQQAEDIRVLRGACAASTWMRSTWRLIGLFRCCKALIASASRRR